MVQGKRHFGSGRLAKFPGPKTEHGHPEPSRVLSWNLSWVVRREDRAATERVLQRGWRPSARSEHFQREGVGGNRKGVGTRMRRLRSPARCRPAFRAWGR